jgi:hypothetical protein
MKDKRKRSWQMSAYNQQLLDVVDLYSRETGITTVDLALVAQWGKDNGHLDLPTLDINKILARSLARACRQEYIKDENGEPVRRRLAYKVKVEKQHVFRWFKMEQATREQMQISGQLRRKGVVADVSQIVRDTNYFNKNHNPGEPIEYDWNINLDMAEKSESGDYDDTPPEEDEDED